jgi:hypothetical protein
MDGQASGWRKAQDSVTGRLGLQAGPGYCQKQQKRVREAR